MSLSRDLSFRSSSSRDSLPFFSLTLPSSFPPFYQLEEASTIKKYLKDLITVMVDRAEKEVDVLMPGYTHLQVSFLFLPCLPFFLLPTPTPSPPTPYSLLPTHHHPPSLPTPLSEPNQSDGPTSSSPTPSPSTPISLVSQPSSLESPSSLSVAELSLETPSAWIETSSPRSLDSTRLRRTRFTGRGIGISSSSSCSGELPRWVMFRGWRRI